MSLVWLVGVVAAAGKDAKEMDYTLSLKTHRSSSPMRSTPGAEGDGSPSAAKLKRRKIVKGPRTPELGCRRTVHCG